MRRKIPVLLSLMLALLMLLTACGSSGGISDLEPPPFATGTAPTVSGGTVRLLSYSPFDEAVLENLAEVLDDAGLPVNLEVNVLGGAGSYGSTMAAFKADIPENDLILFGDYSLMAEMNEQGYLADLSAYPELSPALYEQLPQAALSSVQIDGALVAYPLLGSEGVDPRPTSVYLRKDVLDALGAEPPENPDELLELCILARDAGLPCDFVVSNYAPGAFHRTYPEWPFFVDTDETVLITSDGEVQPYVDSEIFHRDMEMYARFREEGVLRPIYIYRDEQAFRAEWNALAALHPFGSQTRDDLISVQFAPEAPNLHQFPQARAYLAVSASAEDPGLAAAFIDAVYSDREIFNAFVYGEEGVDWAYLDSGAVEILHDTRHMTGLNYTTLPMDLQDGADAYYLPADTVPDFDPGAYCYLIDYEILSRVGSSRFSSHCGMEYIRDGSLPPERMPDALRSLEQAGLGEIVESYRAQYEAYMGK